MGSMAPLLLVIPLAMSGFQLAIHSTEQVDPREEALIAKALLRATIKERDIPDYGQLPDKSRIVVLNRTEWGGPQGHEITDGALPGNTSVQFVLHSKTEIQEMANQRGELVYIAIGRLLLDPGAGRVQIAVHGAVAQNTEKKLKMYASGGGYELAYLWRNASWIFDRILSRWIS